MLIAVNYHYIRSSFDYPHDGIHGITPRQFETQLETLAAAGTYVDSSAVRAAVRGERPLSEKSLLVTFDDGFREHYETAWPILNRLGIPAIFYVNTQPSVEGVVSRVHKIHLLRAHVAPRDFVEILTARSAKRGIPLVLDDRFQAEVAVQYRYDAPEVAKLKYLLNLGLDPSLRDSLLDEIFAEVFPGAERQMSDELYMTREQMKDLAEAGAIGNHSHEHLPLGLIPPAAAREQLRKAADCLEAWTGHRPFTFSYPYGSRAATSSAVGQIAAASGYDFGFTMERAANRDFSEPVHLARFDTNDVPGGKSARFTVDDLFAKAPSRSWYGQAA